MYTSDVVAALVAAGVALRRRAARCAARGGRPRGYTTPLIATALLLFAAGAHAQDVHWEHPGRLGAGQPAAITLAFADTEPAGPVAPPPVDDLTILGPPSRQSSISIVNGARSASLTFSFPVRAEREGRLTIPSFAVETADGTQTVAALSIEVGAATLPSGNRAAAAKLSDVVEARLTPSTMTPYAGEVFDVGVIVGLTAGRRGEVIGTPTWDNPGVVAETWSDGQAVSTNSGAGVRFHTRAVSPQAGRIEVAPLQQEVAIESGRERVDPFADFDDAFGAMRRFGGASLFDSFFGGQKTSATVRSNAVQLDVQPLPQPAPEGFSGAVGQFELTTDLAPAQLKTGEPITWTLTLSGTGNWPGGVALPARAVPADFRTLQPKQRKDFADGELFDGSLSEDLVLVPNQPGDYLLQPVRFVYFDPAKGEYQTIEAQPPVLHITGAPIAPPSRAEAAAVASQAAAAPVAQPASAPPGQAGQTLLPRDPLAGSAAGFAPIGSALLAQLAGAPFALLILYWIGLAVLRARLTDPRRPHRLAYRRLVPAIERVRQAASAEERIAALLAWQHTAATALGLDRAAPTAEQLPDQRWMDVWAGSERALYGREHALPGGWCDRALAVCTRTRRPRFNPLRALTIRNLMPKAATAALLLLCSIGPVRAAESADAYKNGDSTSAHPVAATFRSPGRAELAAAPATETTRGGPSGRHGDLKVAATRTTYEQRLARATQAPDDWIARYNLGLAAAQLGDLPRALAESVAAFVHAPRHEAVRWNAQAFAAQVPGFDRGAAALIAAPRFAALASPAAWQALLIVGAVVGCSGAALVLRRRYRSAPGRSRLAPALLVAGLAIGGTAAAGLHAYGPLADPRVAVVAGQPLLRSVPTDAEAAQQQKPLAAGTLVVVERDFLGWLKVDLRGGESGWLRHGDVVPLYAAPSA